MTKFICRVCDNEDPCILFFDEKLTFKKMNILPTNCPFDNESEWEFCKED